MARVHPFDFTFGAVADEWFGAVRAGAAAEERDPFDLAQFAKLSAVERILGQLQADPAETSAAEAADEYLRLLYVAFHYWAAGRQTVSLARETLERGLAAAAAFESAKTLRLSSPVYFQLPEHRFWGQLSPGEPHEPIDGFFVVVGGGVRGEWLVVAILGFRPEREGFSQISVTATAGDVVAATPAREPPLAPVMPGGEAAGFHSVMSVAEMLILVRLALISSAQ